MLRALRAVPPARAVALLAAIVVCLGTGTRATGRPRPHGSRTLHAQDVTSLPPLALRDLRESAAYAPGSMVAPAQSVPIATDFHAPQSSPHAEDGAPHPAEFQPAPPWLSSGAIPGESLVRKQGLVAYNNASYGVSFWPGSVDFTAAGSASGSKSSDSPANTTNSPATGTAAGTGGDAAADIPTPDPVPEFRMEFAGVTVDGVVLAGTEGTVEPQVWPDERRIEYERGPVIERYLLAMNSMEQLFVVRELPQRGELAVSVRVNTPGQVPPDGTVSDTLTFSAVPTMAVGDASVVVTTSTIVITGATIFDAAGQELTVPLSWANGQYTITIPSDWVATATLPITIDPNVGGLISVDTSTGATWGHVVAMATNASSNEWLVVWNERVGASSFDWDVYARRVFTTGTTGPLIPVAIGPQGAYEAHCEWGKSGNKYLIVWRNDPANNGSNGDQELWGRRLNGGTDTFYDPSAIVIASGPVGGGGAWNPRIGYGNNRFFIVWAAVVSSTNWMIKGRFIAEAVTVPGAITVLSSPDVSTLVPERRDFPDVSFTNKNSKFLVVWTTRTVIGQAKVMAQRFNDLNAAEGANLQVSSGVPGTPGYFSCSHAIVGGQGPGTGQVAEWLVAWDELTTTTSCNVKIRRVRGDGTMPLAPLTIGSTTWPATTHGAWPDVGWDREGGKKLWYVVWHQYDPISDGYRLLGRAVNTNNPSTGWQLGLTTDTIVPASLSMRARYGAVGLDTRPNTNVGLVAFWNSRAPGSIQAQRIDIPSNPF